MRLGDVLAALAAVDREAGDYDAALKTMDAAIAQYERAIGISTSVDARDSLATAYEDEAEVLLRLGRVGRRAGLGRQGPGHAREARHRPRAARPRPRWPRPSLNWPGSNSSAGDAAAADAALRPGDRPQIANSRRLRQTSPARAQIRPPQSRPLQSRTPAKEDFETRRLRAQALESLAAASAACVKVADARKAHDQAVQLRKQLADDDPADALAKAACQAADSAAAAMELLAGDSRRPGSMPSKR